MILTNYQSSDTSFNEFIQDHIQFILISDNELREKEQLKNNNKKELITETNYG